MKISNNEMRGLGKELIGDSMSWQLTMDRVNREWPMPRGRTRVGITGIYIYIILYRKWSTEDISRLPRRNLRFKFIISYNKVNNIAVNKTVGNERFENLRYNHNSIVLNGIMFRFSHEYKQILYFTRARYLICRFTS